MNSILIIYTGGTIGMVQDKETGALVAFDFDTLIQEIPEIKKINASISSVSFSKPIDSSDIQPKHWVELCKIIEENYPVYDGFVVLHGSDTMAYTASALSFMIENLKKPIILTGSQLPIGAVRTDAKENLLSAIEIAASKFNGKMLVPEVAIYFEYNLYRGNRSTKVSAEQFEAFQSPNYPFLAEAGVNLKFNSQYLFQPNEESPTVFHYELDAAIATLKIFPGITKSVVESITTIPHLKALVIETFGAGNTTTERWFIDCLKKAIENNVIIVNISQCISGSVEQGKYETSSALKEIGVIGGKDLTFESAITKLMYLFGKKLPLNEVKTLMQQSIRGELSV